LVLEDPAVYLDLHPDTRSEAIEGYASLAGRSRKEAEGLVRPNLAIGWSEEDVAGKVDAVMKGDPAAIRAVFAENNPWDQRELIDRVTCPTLLVCAELENGGAVLPPAMAAFRANPNVRLLTIPDADHDIHRTAFDPCMAAVKAFLTA
jgi:pimeloyl-ACP methyl ester carboxylesterase